MIWNHKIGNPMQLIKRGYINVSPLSKLNGSLPCIWFTASENWINPLPDYITDIKYIGKQNELNYWRAFRVSIDKYDDLIDWDTYKERSEIGTILVRDFEKKLKISAVIKPQWYFSLETIPIERWKYIDQYDGEKWVRMFGNTE